MSDRTSAATILIVSLLTANLGLSAYIAFRPAQVGAAAEPKDSTTSVITEGEANKLAEALIPLYNQKSTTTLYARFDQLAKVQFTQEQLSAQIEKLGSLFGRIEGCAYSHAKIAGVQGGRTYYTLHYKLSLAGGPLPSGDMTLTVTRNADGLGLFGFYINGTSGPRPE